MHHFSFNKPTLIYFPITFCGITQFLPPKPFQQQQQQQTQLSKQCDDENGNDKKDHYMRTKRNKTIRPIPSDTAAFNCYSKALSDVFGHNLDYLLLKDVL